MDYHFRILLGAGLALALVPSACAQGGWQHIGNVTSVEALAEGVELAAGAARVRVTAVAPGVVRVRLAFNGRARIQIVLRLGGWPRE